MAADPHTVYFSVYTQKTLIVDWLEWEVWPKIADPGPESIWTIAGICALCAWSHGRGNMDIKMKVWTFLHEILHNTFIHNSSSSGHRIQGSLDLQLLFKLYNKSFVFKKKTKIEMGIRRWDYPPPEIFFYKNQSTLTWANGPKLKWL